MDDDMASMKDFSMLEPVRTKRMEDIDRKINDVFGGVEDAPDHSFNDPQGRQERG